MEEWPSKRVAQGGVFNPPKVIYSPETKKFLQALMQESKLTMMQRNKINYSLRSNEPLPPLTRVKPKQRQMPPEIVIKPTSGARRKLSSIVESGAYQPDRYVPMTKGVDREYQKKHLQDFMAFGKEIKEVPKKKRSPKEEEDVNRFDQLKTEIKEREEWLEDMEKLGEGHKYRILIEQQIATRIKEMESLKMPKK